MSHAKVIISYAELSVPHLIEFSKNVVNKMATNGSIFPSPDVALSTLNTTINNLEIKYNAAQGGGKQQKLELDKAEKELRYQIRIEGLYVERIANGNEVIITSSGYNYWVTSKTNNQPDFLVDNTPKEGEVILKRKMVNGAKAWVWQQNNNPLQTDQWTQLAITTQSNYVVENLNTCTRMWFRSAYITKDGQSSWCDPQMIIIT